MSLSGIKGSGVSSSALFAFSSFSGQPTPTTPTTPPPPQPHLFLLLSPPLPNYSLIFPSSPSRLIHSASSSLFSQGFFLHSGGGCGSGSGNGSGGSRPVRSEAWVGCVCISLVRLSLHCLPLLALSLPSLISMLIRKVTNQYIQWPGLAIDTISIHLPLAAKHTHTVTRKQLLD